MNKTFKNIFISLLAFIAIVAALPKNSYATNDGATIESTNCDPAADPTLDYQKTDPTLKSCVSQGITFDSATNPYKVHVKFDGNPNGNPPSDFGSLYMGACSPAIYYLTLSGGAAGLGLAGDCTRAATQTGAWDIPVGSTVGELTAPTYFGGGALINIEARVVNDKVCVFVSTPLPLLLNFNADRSDAYNTNYNITPSTGLPTNCVYMPLPTAPTKPAVPAFIAPSCIDYNATASQYRWPGNGTTPGITRSFTGVVVQCVEDTMMNLFFNKRGTNTQTVFVKMQQQLISMIKGLMALYIIFLGYKYIMFEKGGIKRNEWIWIALKLGLVMYFAAGTGMTDILPGVISTVKNLSAIVVDAAAGASLYTAQEQTSIATANLNYTTAESNYEAALAAQVPLQNAYDQANATYTDDNTASNPASEADATALQTASDALNAANSAVTNTRTALGVASDAVTTAAASSNKGAAQAALNAAQSDYNTKMAAYSVARTNWAQYYVSNPPVPGVHDQAGKDALGATMNAAKLAMDNSNALLQQAKTAALSFGYDYCDFRPLMNAGMYNYTTTALEATTMPDGTVIPVGGSITRDMSYMHLWDSIDCRISKYLGVGEDPTSPASPKILLVGIGSIFSSMYGLLISALIVTFLIFVILIIVRMVHIYLMAFIALVLLAYIAPLVIPMILFEYTKSSFEAWLKQFIGFAVQPIILFAFLAFMFAIFDSVIYGDNYNFQPMRPCANCTPNTPQTVTQYNADPSIAPIWADNAIVKIQDPSGNGNWICNDEDAIGCLYEKVGLATHDLVVGGATIFRIYQTVNLTDSNIGINLAPGAVSSSGPVSISDSDYKTLLLGLMKLVFVCFIMHALLQQVEEMSQTLTNVAGGGITKMSAAPTADPTAIVQQSAGPALQMMGKGALKVAGGVGGAMLNQTVGRAMRSARRSELRETKENK